MISPNPKAKFIYSLLLNKHLCKAKKKHGLCGVFKDLEFLLNSPLACNLSKVSTHHVKVFQRCCSIILYSSIYLSCYHCAFWLLCTRHGMSGNCTFNSTLFSARKQKQKREEQPRVPRSLFDRANAQLLRLRRDAKLQMKLKMSGNLKPYRPVPTLAPAKPVMEQAPDHPEWLIHEDWALLQVGSSLIYTNCTYQMITASVNFRNICVRTSY